LENGELQYVILNYGKGERRGGVSMITCIKA
jgi:hypothetical protein